MPLQHVSIDLSGVASREVGWHSQSFPDGLKICGLLNPNSETSVLEMPHPTGAATAIWILVNQDRRGFGFGGGPLPNDKTGHQSQRTPARHTVQFVRHANSPFVTSEFLS